MPPALYAAASSQEEPVEQPAQEPFNDFMMELADGARWRLIRGEDWDRFVERLSQMVAELPPRRRQAVLMLLFALMDELVTAEEAREWLAQRDLDSDEAVEELIGWLRRFRPTIED